jgi:hypothetical protein
VVDGVLRVTQRTSVAWLVEQIRAGLVQVLEGNGWRSCAIAMNACREAAGIAVFDPSDFSSKADKLVSTDRTLGRSAHSKQPWALCIYELTPLRPFGWGTIDRMGESGDGRLYLFPTLATPRTESQSDPDRTLSPSSPE